MEFEVERTLAHAEPWIWALGAGLLGIAIAVGLVLLWNVQLRRQVERATRSLYASEAHFRAQVEKDRTAIAREIHDEFGQALTSVKIHLALLGPKLPKEQRSCVEEMTAVLDTTLAGARAIAARLRPPLLHELGLAVAIEEHARGFIENTGIPCDLRVDADDLPPDRNRDDQVFRILQEALTNIARHAGATRVDIRLASTDGRLTLEVEDDGRGIPRHARGNGRSLGLLGMRERAAGLGGKVEIGSGARGGTLVRVDVPHAAREARS